MTFTLPIYYTQEFKTKDDKTFLLGMNWYRNAHYHIQNKVKQDLEASLLKQFEQVGPILGPYKVHYTVYYKNPSCDGANIVALSEKFFLDALQVDLVRQDSVRHHLGSTWVIGGCDKLNPRVEINISGVSNNTC